MGSGNKNPVLKKNESARSFQAFGFGAKGTPETASNSNINQVQTGHELPQFSEIYYIRVYYYWNLCILTCDLEVKGQMVKVKCHMGQGQINDDYRWAGGLKAM